MRSYFNSLLEMQGGGALGARLATEDFNSLLEMRNPQNPWRLPHPGGVFQFSIGDARGLHRRESRGKDHRFQFSIGDANFGSAVRALWYTEYFNSLLEMYDTTEPVATELKPEDFNSLLEMPVQRAASGRDPRAVQPISILYWRCRRVATPSTGPTESSAISILYWRC